MKNTLILNMDSYEQRVIVNALNQMRTNLIKEEQDTSPVDEILLKVIDAPYKESKGERIFGYTY